MKQRILLSVVAACALGASSGFAQTVTTPPVGFVNITIPAATAANAPASAVVGFSLQKSSVFTGTVSALGANTINTSGSVWSVNQFSSTAHFVQLATTATTAQTFLVSANGTNSLTVSTAGTDLTTVSQVGRSFSVFPAWTFATLFGSGTSAVVYSNSNATLADNVMVWNGASWETYYHNSTNWRKVGSLANQNNTVIYPDESVFFVRRAQSSLTLTVLGAVPITGFETPIPGTGGEMIANRFPTDTTLKALGFQNLPGWQSSTNVVNADNLLIWSGAAWETYYFNGTAWRKVGSLASQDNKAILQGTGYFVKRTGTQSGVVLTGTLPYSL